MNKRVEQMVPRPVPVSLSPDELDVANHPIKTADHVVPVKVWVRFPETAVQEEGVAFEWTDKAVHVQWKGPDGARVSAWVWANSVERLT